MFVTHGLISTMRASSREQFTQIRVSVRTVPAGFLIFRSLVLDFLLQLRRAFVKNG